MALARSEAKKECLQAALQSMVRLCIVAPSVSLHIHNTEKTLKGKFPAARVKRLIEEEVLPRYTELYAQAHDGAAPEGEEKLENWLESMLAAMYESMKEHLSDIFRDNVIRKADFEWVSFF